MNTQKSDVRTRLEEDEKISALDTGSILSVKENIESEGVDGGTVDSDEEDVNFKQFDPDLAWNSIIDDPECLQVTISPEVQKSMKVEVGVNMTSEFPWKQIKFKAIVNHLLDELEESETLKEKFDNVSLDDFVLIGYCEKLSEKDDVFLMFPSDEAARRAGEVIKNLEAYDRWMIDRMIYKKPRRVKKKTDESAVELDTEKKTRKYPIEVDFQSIYPLKHSRAPFSMRLSSDVRDGYVELVPGDEKYENVFRRTIDACIQAGQGKVDLEQQTDPTFPSNAWSQYLYEINTEDDGLDKPEERKGGAKKLFLGSRPPTPLKTPTPPPTPPTPCMSEQIKNLLETLEFNQIDMYRNDYPLIGSRRMPKYSVPSLQESMCFVDMSRTLNRYVCGVDWHPTIPGLVVASYTFSTLATTVKEKENVDEVKRAVFEENPILMWSFDDSLSFKLEFKSDREVTCLSFCPYDENLLLGGTINGQILIWDLKGRIEECEKEEILTATDAKYRSIMNSHLSWTKPVDQHVVVKPAASSVIGVPDTSPITSIKWLNRHHYITPTGQARENPNEEYRFFVTCSFDVSIAFWNLDMPVDRIKEKATTPMELPQGLHQEVSKYQKLDGVLTPIYILTAPECITSAIFDWGVFEYKLQETNDKKVSIKVKPTEQDLFRQKLICGSITGKLTGFSWEGFDVSKDMEICREALEVTEEYALVHDGPIIGVEKNPFLSNIFVSIGRTIFAIWKEGFLWTPILWRRVNASITAAKWSCNRPAVLFIVRSDGIFEAWDFLSRTNAPIISEMISGGIITAMSEHRVSVPQKVLDLGDYNSSFRMLKLPEIFEAALPNEKERFRKYIDKEENRKTSLRDWQDEWRAKNEDILNARKLSASKAQVDLEELRKEAQEVEEQNAKQDKEYAEKLAQKKKAKVVFDLPEKLEKKWDEKNLKRLMNVLMSCKRVDSAKLEKQTALEKDAQAYNKSKRQAIKESFKKVGEEIAMIRARLLPIEIEDTEQMEHIKESVKKLVEESETYSEVEAEAEAFMKKNPQNAKVTFSEFLDRGQKRLEIINKALGANTERRHFYNNLKVTGELDKYTFGTGAIYEGLRNSSDKQAEAELASTLEESIEKQEISENSLLK